MLHAEVTDLIPGRGTKIPATRHSQKKKKEQSPQNFVITIIKQCIYAVEEKKIKQCRKTLKWINKQLCGTKLLPLRTISSLETFLLIKISFPQNICIASSSLFFGSLLTPNGTFLSEASVRYLCRKSTPAPTSDSTKSLPSSKLSLSFIYLCTFMWFGSRQHI